MNNSGVGNLSGRKAGMFRFINDTLNPLGGSCPHQCMYCWRHALVERFPDLRTKYLGVPTLDAKQLKPVMNENKLIFLCTMTDLFAVNVPEHMILTILEFVKKSRATFLLQTKNPKRFLDFLDVIPENTLLGSTIESNRDYFSISKGPSQHERLVWMAELRKKTNLPLFVPAEPILDFDLEPFLSELQKIGPSKVAVGYDNYNHKMPEPSLEKTLKLIEGLKEFTTVETKTLRPMWNAC